jgi:hypothetical protein
MSNRLGAAAPPGFKFCNGCPYQRRRCLYGLVSLLMLYWQRPTRETFCRRCISSYHRCASESVHAVAVWRKVWRHACVPKPTPLKTPSEMRGFLSLALLQLSPTPSARPRSHATVDFFQLVAEWAERALKTPRRLQ